MQVTATRDILVAETRCMPQEEVANSLGTHWEAVRRECAHCSQNPNRLPVWHCLLTAWLPVTVSTPSLVNNGWRHCLLPNHANTIYPRRGFRIFFPSLSFTLSFFCPQRQEKLMWISKKEEFVLDNLHCIQDIFKRMIPSISHMWVCVFISFPHHLLPPSLRIFFFYSPQGHSESGRIYAGLCFALPVNVAMVETWQELVPQVMHSL